MSKIALVTCVWRRHGLTAAWWRFVKHLRTWWAPHDLHVVCVGSNDPEHARMARAADAQYVDGPNIPLSLKWNTALYYARRVVPDAVIILASDDFFDAAMARRYRDSFSQHAYLGLRDFYFVDLVQPQTGYWPGYRDGFRMGEPVGSGRVLSASLCDRLDWRLWPGSAQQGLDGSMHQELRRVGYVPDLLSVRDGGVAVGCKTDCNIWTYRQVAPEPVTTDVLATLPADVQEGIRQWR